MDLEITGNCLPKLGLPNLPLKRESAPFCKEASVGASKVIVPNFQMSRGFLYALFYLFYLFFLFSGSPLKAAENYYADPYTRALKNYLKGDLEKAERLAFRSLEKDSINPGALFVRSLLQSDTAYHRYDLDSAYRSVNLALDYLRQVDERELRRLERNEIDSAILFQQKKLVEQKAFEQASEIHTESSYSHFIEFYAEADEVPQATLSLHDLAFQRTRKEDTYQAYKAFMEQFPEASQVPEAERLFNDRIFEAQTKGDDLKSYHAFLAQFPNTPYRRQVEWSILSIESADFSREKLLAFIKRYPNSSWNSWVLGALYHLDPRALPSLRREVGSQWHSVLDSLKAIQQSNELSLVAYLERGRYGFMELQSGKTLLPAQYLEVEEAYFCGNILQNYLRVKEEDTWILINRKGIPFFSPEGGEIFDLESGFLKWEKNGKSGLVHKSGQVMVSPQWDDLKVVLPGVIAFKQGNKWGISTVLGRIITDPTWSDVQAVENYIAVHEKNRMALIHRTEVFRAADTKRINFSYRFDDYEILAESTILAFMGEKEALLGPDGVEWIPLQEHKIYRFHTDWMVESDYGSYFYTRKANGPIKNLRFDRIQFNDQLLALAKGGLWAITTLDSIKKLNHRFEEVRLIGNHFALGGNDQVFELFASNLKSLGTIDPSRIRLIKGADIFGKQDIEFLTLEGKDGLKTIVNEKGDTLLQGKYEQIQLINPNTFMVQVKGKKGLVDILGKEILKPEYEALALQSPGKVSLLLKGKFGHFDLRSLQLLKPQYDQAVESLDSSLYLVKKGRYFQVVDEKNSKIFPGDYEEVIPANDSLFFLKSEDYWELRNRKNKEPIFDQLLMVDQVGENAEGKYYELWTREGNGIFHTSYGLFGSATFNDIVNLGTPEQPLFFCEKNVKEADYYVVVYLNARKKTIRRDAFKAKEYERIYCDQ